MLAASRRKKIDLNLLLVAALVALPSAYALTNLGLFEDLEIYFHLFSQVKDNGVSAAISQFFILTNKFEPIIFLIFYVQSLVGVDSVFGFLFINFLLLNYLYVDFARRIFEKIEVRFFYFSAIVALFSYSFFSREIYIWRSMYAFLFLLLFIDAKTARHRSVCFVLGALTHSTFIFFCMTYWCIEYGIGRFQRNVFYVYYVVCLVLALLLVNLLSSFSVFTSSGDIEVFTASNPSHSLQSFLIVIFTTVALLAFMRCSSSDKERTLALFCLFLCFIALSSHSGYHLMNRVAAPALCLTPFLVLFKSGFRSHFYFYIKLCYLISIVGTFRLLYLFQSEKFILPA